MLKITTHMDDDEDVIIFMLEGKLAGPWVAELDQCWQTTPTTPKRQGCRVDLTGVTYVDAEGKALLARMHSAGAELIAAGCLTKGIVEEIMRAGPFDRSSHQCQDESIRQPRDIHTKEERR